MIYQREMHEAYPFKQDLSTRSPYPLEGSSFVNQKLTLPPISSAGTNLVESNSSSLQQHRNFASLPAMDSLTLPKLDLCSLGLQNRKRGNSSKTNLRKACKDIQDNATFSLPHVYSVLPPIGKTCIPCAPSSRRKTELHSSDLGGSDNSKKHFNNDSLKRKCQSTQKSRIKRQTSEESVTVTEVPVVDDKSVETTIKCSKQQNEIIAIYISDTCVMPERESDFTPTVNKVDERRNVPDEEDSALASSNVPREFRLYVDVYPASPTQNLRWGRGAIEKKRQELREDNNIRLGFMESVSVNRRRNATCPELDIVLTNAVELLREIFLRKTMEELCMMW